MKHFIFQTLKNWINNRLNKFKAGWQCGITTLNISLNTEILEETCNTPEKSRLSDSDEAMGEHKSKEVKLLYEHCSAFSCFGQYKKTQILRMSLSVNLVKFFGVRYFFTNCTNLGLAITYLCLKDK